MSVRIAVVGAGYVGLTVGACLADLGHDVICIDTDVDKIAGLRAGSMPIYEDGLAAVVARNVAAERLDFSSDIGAAIAGREAVFIAVGTPSDAEGNADLSHVFAAAAAIADNLGHFTLVATKSTVPVGTNRRIGDILRERLGGDDLFAVASNPEFLREGAAIEDFMSPDRVIVGAEDERALDVLRRIYAPMTARGVPMLTTNSETAEMIKYAANAFLAVKVSFINEIADLSEKLGADVRHVAKGLGLDKRIGASFLRAGPGWGGSCFPKDTRALLKTADAVGAEVRIVEAALGANDARKRAMVDRIRDACGGSVAGKRIAVLGVTFKGQTDDMRESPSLEILPRLVADGASVVVYDPAQPADAERLLPGVHMVDDPLAAASGADLLVVLTDWTVFRALDLKAIRGAMQRAVMLDLRNLFDREAVLKAGFERHIGIGYPARQA